MANTTYKNAILVTLLIVPLFAASFTMVAQNAFAVPEFKIPQLILAVDNLGLNKGQTESLTQHLENALRALDRSSDEQRACIHLDSFINEIEGLVKGGHITEEAAQPFIDTAIECINELCPQV